MADYRTEYQKVCEAIRDAIMRGEFAPGQRLPQRKLAAAFGTTTITVREALRSLEKDGLITIEPKWGAMVVEITPERIRGRYIVREALEGMAARLACRNATEAERLRITELAERCDRELLDEEVSRREKAGLHYSLHEQVVAATRCEELIQSINRNNLHTILLSNAYHIDWSHDDPHRHRHLAGAILSGDEELAESTMRAHVRDGYTMELRAIQGSP